MLRHVWLSGRMLGWSVTRPTSRYLHSKNVANLGNLNSCGSRVPTEAGGWPGSWKPRLSHHRLAGRAASPGAIYIPELPRGWGCFRKGLTATHARVMRWSLGNDYQLMGEPPPQRKEGQPEAVLLPIKSRGGESLPDELLTCL